MRILLSLSLLLLLAVSAGAGTITVRADNWPPFNGNPKETKAGYMIEVLREIYAPLGDKIDYQLLSWDDSLASVRKGQFNAVVGASRDDAADFIFPQESFGVSANTFFVPGKSNWVFNGMASLGKIKLGVIEDYAYSDEIDNYIKANKKSGKVVISRGEEALALLINKLQSGRVDAVVEDASVMMFALMKLGMPPGQIKSAGSAQDNQDLYIAFAPGNPASKGYAQQFDEGIRKLRATGKLQQILTRYNLSDWKK
jgi:polar amino acid transport system substrate-binding protein